MINKCTLQSLTNLHSFVSVFGGGDNFVLDGFNLLFSHLVLLSMQLVNKTEHLQEM